MCLRLMRLHRLKTLGMGKGGRDFKNFQNPGLYDSRRFVCRSLHIRRLGNDNRFKGIRGIRRIFKIISL